MIALAPLALVFIIAVVHVWWRTLHPHPDD